MLVGMLLVLGAVDAALAQPFGMTRNAPPPEVGGFAGWIFAKQAEFYRMMSGTIRAAKADGSAAYTLMGISFLYGIFHAAGPGHGKAVISSYLVANNETWRRGVVLSFASALLQAVVAIAIVGIAAVLLNATAKTMGNAVRVIEIVSYGLIVLIGLRLLWVKGRALLHLLRPGAHDHHAHAHATGTRTIMAMTIIITTRTRKLPPGAMPMRRSRRNSPAAIGCGTACRRSSRSVCGRARAPSSCWCSRWRRGCSGSAPPRPSSWGSAPRSRSPPSPRIAVGARGLAGRLAKAKPGAGMLLLRGFETAAAALIVAFGALLLTGYMVSERLVGV